MVIDGGGWSVIGLVVRLVWIDWCVISWWHQWGVWDNSWCVVIGKWRLLNVTESLWGGNDWGRSDDFSRCGSCVNWRWEVVGGGSSNELGWGWGDNLGNGYGGCWFCHDCVKSINSVSSLIMETQTWLELLLNAFEVFACLPTYVINGASCSIGFKQWILWNGNWILQKNSWHQLTQKPHKCVITLSLNTLLKLPFHKYSDVLTSVQRKKVTQLKSNYDAN